MHDQQQATTSPDPTHQQHHAGEVQVEQEQQQPDEDPDHDHAVARMIGEGCPHHGDD